MAVQLAPVASVSSSKCSGAQANLRAEGLLEVKGVQPRVALPAGVETWRKLINEMAGKHGVPPCLVAAVIGTESGGNPNARSGVGATGLMQLMPQYFGGDSDALLDPRTNVDKGTAHLAKLLRQHEGNLVHVLASYNAGSPRCGVSCWTNSKTEERTCCPANQWDLIVNCGKQGSFVDQVIGRWNAARDAGYGFVAPPAAIKRSWSWLLFGVGLVAGVAATEATHRLRSGSQE